MAWDDACSKLRDILADRYLDVEDARRIALEAQLERTKIHFSDKAQRTWTSIVENAEKERRILALLDVNEVRIDFRDNEAFKKLRSQFSLRSGQSSSTLNIPRLLLHLADRERHEHDIQALINALGHSRNRPLVYIINGDEYQSHDMFIKRMNEIILPRLLTVGNQESIVQDHLIQWPGKGFNERELNRWMLQKLAEEIAPDTRDTNSSDIINKALALHPGPTMIHTHILTRDWFNNSPLPTLLDFWSNWPDMISTQITVICLSIKYEDHRKFSWMKKRKYKQYNNEIRKELAGLKLEQFPDLYFAVLPELEDVDRSDVENWARRREVGRFCSVDKLLTEIGQLFNGREKIPMNALANELEKILLRQCA